MVELLNHFAGLGVVLEDWLMQRLGRDHGGLGDGGIARGLENTQQPALCPSAQKQLLEFPVLKAWDAVIAVTRPI